jgi:phage terminase large subunit-like protein
MASNMVVRQDANGNLTPDKGKVTERIDGIVATIMGLAVAAVDQQPPAPAYQMIVLGRR